MLIECKSPEKYGRRNGVRHRFPCSRTSSQSRRGLLEDTSPYFRISLFQFLISCFRLGGRYFMCRTASLKVPRCRMIFFCSRMMD